MMFDTVITSVPYIRPRKLPADLMRLRHRFPPEFLTPAAGIRARRRLMCPTVQTATVNGRILPILGEPRPLS